MQTALAVLSAGLVAGMGHAALPFTGARPELGLGIAGSAEPGAVLTALLNALGRHGVHPFGLVLSAWATAAFLYRGAPASPQLRLPKLLRVTRTAPRAAA